MCGCYAVITRRRRESDYIPEDGQQNVDEEISTTSALKKDTERWEDDGENDLADIAIVESVYMFLFLSVV